MNATENELAHAAQIADIFLVAALKHQARRLFIEPASASSHRVVLHRQGRPVASAFLPKPLGSTVIERYRYIAELDPSAGKRQSATWPLAAGGQHCRVFLSTHGEGDGSRAEMWILDAEEEPDAEIAPLMTATRVRPGDTIGPLEITAVLGAGGMGVVYRAHHQWLDRDCAVKILRPEITVEAGSLDAFFREARLAAKTDHDGSVTIMDVGTLPDGRPYIVMELIQGKSFDDIIAADGPVEPRRAARLVRETARALSGLHERGIVHCDVTMSNVFVSGDAPEEKVKIVDFGSARVHDDQDESADIVFGTPYYMAPEQIRGARCDARTDLYALGVCLFELITGVPPFEGDTAVQIARRHLNETAPAPLSPHGDVPRALLGVLARMLEKKPEDRYQSAAELVAAIDPILRESGKRTTKLWLSALG